MAPVEPVRPSWTTILGVALVGAYVLVVFHAMNTVSYDQWGALVIGPLLLALAWPMIARLGRTTDQPWLPRLLWASLCLKLIAGYCRYLVSFNLYDGRADARRYDLVGKDLADSYLHGVFQAPSNGTTGTGFLMILTGIVYVLIGSSLVGGFLVFSWLSFWGLYLIYKAYVVAVPEGDHHRFALLLFFLPSMLFWPSGIGKEAWMVLCIGIATLGAAWLYTRHRFAFITMGVGLLGTAMVRPHVTLMLFGGIFAGYLFRSDRGRSILAPVWKLAGILLLVGTGFVLLGQAETFLGVEGGLTGDSINAELERANERTDEGGSSYVAQPVGSPADLPRAAVTVLFRPFPWEAVNAQSLATAAESLFLIGLLVMAVPRLKHVPAFAVKRPFIMLCLVYIVLAVVGFANFGNFGILARQRVQVYPFVLALICLPMRGPDRLEPRSRRPEHIYPDRRLLEEGTTAR